MWSANLPARRTPSQRFSPQRGLSSRRLWRCLPPSCEPLEDRTAPALLFGLTSANALIRLDTATPGTLISSTPITGLQGGAGETVLGLDFRPADRQLYAVTNNTGTGRLYTINTTTGAATLRATLAADPTDLTNPFTALSGASFGVDFNPVPDRLRVVSDANQNLRINPANGLVITDDDLNPGDPTVVGSGYTNSFPGTAATTLFGIDSGTDSLVIQNPPNNGTLAVVGAGLGVGDIQATVGFDIRLTAGVNQGFAALTTDGTTSALYTVDLTAGTAALVANIGASATLVTALAVAPEGAVARLAGATATFTGGFTDDVLALNLEGGALRHNRFTAGDAGFVSDFDFDSTLPGEQRLLAVPTVQVIADMGDGNDTVLGSPFGDVLRGDAGNDLLDGRGGNDVLLGLAGVDTLLGGDGNDFVLGGAGNDAMFGDADADILVWNPGDGSDLFEGGTGTDVLVFNGAAGNDTFTLTAVGARLRFDRQPANIVIDAAGMEQVNVNQDGVFAVSGAQEVPPVTTAASGTATVVYNPVTNLFNIDVTVQGIALANITGFHIHAGRPGFNGPIIVDFPALGFNFVEVPGGIRLTANNVALPAANIHDLLTGNTYFNLHTTANPAGEVRGQVTAMVGAAASGGADTFTINDLAATDVRDVQLNLGLGDAAAADNVTVGGSAANDSISAVVRRGRAVGLAGVTAAVRLVNAEVGDRLTISGEEGDDRLRAGAGVEAIVGVTLNGGDGDDTLVGGAGADVLNGGDGDDLLIGAAGNDQVNGGPGSDRLVESGNGNFVLSDTALAGAGADVLSGAEQATLTGGAGNNVFTVSGWSGTATLIGGAGADRVVSVNDANFTLSNALLARSTGGLFTLGSIELATLVGGAGHNVLNAAAFSGAVALNGLGGNDLLFGGRGNDLLQGGAGNDRLFGGLGADTLLGQAGNDFLDGGLDGVADALIGGLGADVFRAELFPGLGNRDNPLDFVPPQGDQVV